MLQVSLISDITEAYCSICPPISYVITLCLSGYDFLMPSPYVTIRDLPRTQRKAPFCWKCHRQNLRNTEKAACNSFGYKVSISHCNLSALSSLEGIKFPGQLITVLLYDKRITLDWQGQEIFAEERCKNYRGSWKKVRVNLVQVSWILLSESIWIGSSGISLLALKLFKKLKTLSVFNFLLTSFGFGKNNFTQNTY